MPQTVLTIIGTRPEAIKLVPFVLELQRRPDEFRSVVCVTGQHREMLDQVLDAFSIIADHDLNLMAPNQSLAQVTARATAGLDEVYAKVRPDVAIVRARIANRTSAIFAFGSEERIWITGAGYQGMG